ncbi:VCBS repeat-containing protein [Octadecabacter sp. CECT 8868]|uniref:FG-GAP repeat domain-containing protein n=1 Tax=Octadecabacter algicola TaxID=2909342 RepID=UPI001F407E24|nr:VCBS repeat-containing protein [Octadecabacter algicola]MCF2904409.1 VCBS repeat-containing protein [Octadecabacter algicola]
MAPRHPLRPLTGLVRGAGVMLCLGAASQTASQEIVGAEFAGSTERYAHGVLGDAIEYSELVIQTRDGNNRIQYRVTLPSDHVFEDLTPRLWDITGDGEPEVVVVETDMARGGSLAVYDETGKVAETAHIGRSNRWLAPVAAADFDGDGRVEVAFVDRPHLAKTLRIFEWDGAGLSLDTEVSGLTNHRIGDAFFSSGMRDCGTGPEMITADADWSDLMVIRFDEEWQVQSLGGFTPERLATALDCGL